MRMHGRKVNCKRALCPAHAIGPAAGVTSLVAEAVGELVVGRK